ncbi:MAG: BatD family protein, partial [Steroidobacteraceae bacterium]
MRAGERLAGGAGRGAVCAAFVATLAWLAIALWSAPAHAAVNARLDSTRIAPGDSVRLTLEHDGETSSRPDLAPLERDFDVLGTNRMTSVQIVNGSSSSKSEVTVTLAPKHAGRLTVPSIVWDGERSPALALDVVPGNGSAGGAGSAGGVAAGQKVFVRMQFAPPKPYVQEAVHVTLRLYTREALYDPSVSFPATGDVLIQRVGKDQDSSVEKSGESYEVVTRHYVVFPQRSGDIELPGPVLDARVAAGRSANPAFNDPFAGFFGPTPFGNVLSTVKPIRLHSGTISLHVRPRPAGAGQSYWLPATDVTLHGTWHPAALHAQAGNPVTVDLTLQAQGLTAAQLPDLAQLLALPPGLKAYPDQPQLTTTAHGDAVIGARTQSIALIADQPGHFTIPALQVKWWDTGTNRPREATLPARTLVVSAAPGGGSGSASAALVPAKAAPGAAATPRRATGGAGAGPGTRAAPGWHFTGRRPVWLWVSAVLALAWFATLGAWALMRRRARCAAQTAHADSLGSAAHDEAGAPPVAGRRPPASAA